MENHANPVLKLIAEIALALLVIGVVVGIVLFAVSKANTLTNEITKTTDSVLETKFTQYDGENITGANVLNLIKTTYSEDNEVYILVKNKSNSTGVYYCYKADLTKFTAAEQSAAIKKARSKADTGCYITPSGKFSGEVVRNSNDTIVGLIFTQE